MLNRDAVAIKKTGERGPQGYYEVIVTHTLGHEYKSYMLPEEIELINILNTIENKKLREDLFDSIEDYGNKKYYDGYDEGNMDGRTLDY